uniref:CS domain-containing protein n=1 Tax=Rhodosorus marinus TaxID=101924 RepID=A0A6T6N0E7_9RHOD|mmetsp:Transcript_2633/g.3832  ORF Transcript_2633/g.3832 Transcript_2633/m.3832 type:complete len:181 (+) Transcript_2633:329-871(+)
MSSSKTDKLVPNAGNGGETDKYKWTQTLGDLNVGIKFPVLPNKKSVSCIIEESRVSVGVVGQDPILSGELFAKVNADESFWQLDRDESTLELYLEKQNKMEWWKSVVKGEPELDTTKVEPENSKLSDLDGETRGMVEKMMFDQRQKASGLPTSDELQKEQMFEKFKSQHPEMDFSNVKFS